MAIENVLRGAFLLLALASCRGWPDHDDNTIESRLATWLLNHPGAELNGMAVGRECPTCLRGIVATKDFAYEDVIGRFPLVAMQIFPGTDKFSAEHALVWLDRMHNDPTFNASWHLFWEAHPDRDGVFAPDLYTDQQIEMLQTPELEALVLGHRTLAEQVFNGTYGEGKPVPELLPAVDMATFKHVAALIHSRSFGVSPEGSNTTQSALIPIMDLLNHDDEPNTRWYTDHEALVLTALHTIKAGEALTHNYITGVIHRPDMSMFFFGFVTQREEPFLAASDLPGYDADNPYATSPLDDSIYDDPYGEHCTTEEYERLSARLEDMPTSEEQDQHVLDSGMVTDWRLQTILQYRIARKRALRHTLEKIAGHLGGLGREDVVNAGGEQAGQHEAAGGFTSGDDGGSGEL